MLIVGIVSIALVLSTTLVHFEMLRVLSIALPTLAVPARAKLILVILFAFFVHAFEILLYAIAIYMLERYTESGSLGEAGHSSLAAALYFSAETYTSLGYGDVIPLGNLRLLAGVEALNGLLLIGWSASYTYIAMERFWREDGIENHKNGKGGDRNEP